MTAASGMQGLDVLTVSGTLRRLTDIEQQRGALWAAAEVQKAMPDADPEQQREALAELLDCLGLGGEQG